MVPKNDCGPPGLDRASRLDDRESREKNGTSLDIIAQGAENPASGLWSDLAAAHAAIGKARPWFAEGAIEGNPLVVMTAPEKGRKSWITMQLAACAALSGEHAWLGAFPLRRTGSVVYLDAEYGAYEFARRLSRIARGLGAQPLELLQRIRHRYSADLILSTEDPVFRAVVEDVAGDKPALIVLDPLRNHLAGEENDSGIIVKANRCLRLLGSMGQCPVVVLHHVNKSGGYSGSRAIMSTADFILEGSDGDEPVYTARGRTARPFDRIAQPFSVEVEHEHDEDDTQAATRFRLVAQGPGGAEPLPGGLTPIQGKVLGFARTQREPRTVAYIAKAIKRSNADVEAALYELEELGYVAERIGAVQHKGRGYDGWIVGGTQDVSQDDPTQDVLRTLRETSNGADSESSLVDAA